MTSHSKITVSLIVHRALTAGNCSVTPTEKYILQAYLRVLCKGEVLASHRMADNRTDACSSEPMWQSKSTDKADFCTSVATKINTLSSRYKPVIRKLNTTAQLHISIWNYYARHKGHCQTICTIGTFSLWHKNCRLCILRDIGLRIQGTCNTLDDNYRCNCNRTENVVHKLSMGISSAGLFGD